MKPLNAGREVAIAGIGLIPWQRYNDREVHDFSSEAVLRALEDSEMDWSDIQEAFCGSVYQGTCSGHQVLKEIGLTGIPIINVENACSSGTVAFLLAYQAVAAEIYDIVLAVGFEKMPRGPIPSTAFRQYELESGFNLQPANYANRTVFYMEETGLTPEDMARVTVKNRLNGALNPFAYFQKPVTIEEVMHSRMIASPLRLLHCCPITDGAAAVILCSPDKLKNPKRRVSVAAAVLATGVFGGDDASPSLKYPPELDIVELSAQQAFEMAGCGPEEIDVVQAYDTVAPSELWNLEKLGFCGKGEAIKLLRDGELKITGRLPVNTDGGMMSRGHPLGATGLAQIYEIVTQLRQEAGPRQVQDARLGLTHTRGAGPNSVVTILKR
jgi:acetyl-CoA acetyltransferase